MVRMLRQFGAEERGQSLTEYALLLTFILFAVIGVAVGYNKSMSGVTALTNSNLTTAANFIH